MLILLVGFCLLVLADVLIILYLKTFRNASGISQRIPGCCCCFELLGDVVLRMDTGHCQLLVPGTSGTVAQARGMRHPGVRGKLRHRVFSILCPLNFPYGRCETCRNGPRRMVSCSVSVTTFRSPSTRTPIFTCNVRCFDYQP